MNGFIRVLLLLAVVAGAHAFGAEASDKNQGGKPKDTTAKEKIGEDPRDEDDERTGDSEVANILNSMGYPELQVVPRASERLRIEAKEERGSWFVMHWPVELSGLATMANGLLASGYKRDLSGKDEDNFKSVTTFTTAVGAAWIAGGLIMGGQKPYTRGYRTLAKGAPKDERAALLRERLAEESLERPARVMRVLKHVSVISNFSMNVLTGIYLDDEGKVVAGVAALLSFLPYMFEDHSIEVHDKHIEYKKKIYTPLKGASVYVDPETKKLTPMTTLAWTF